MDRFNDRLVAEFATVLRNKRERAGLTQEDLAERADVSARFISFLENGRRQPTLSALAALSDGLGTSMRELVGEVEDGLCEVNSDPGDTPSGGSNS